MMLLVKLKNLVILNLFLLGFFWCFVPRLAFAAVFQEGFEDNLKAWEIHNNRVVDGKAIYLGEQSDSLIAVDGGLSRVGKKSLRLGYGSAYLNRWITRLLSSDTLSSVRISALLYDDPNLPVGDYAFFSLNDSQRTKGVSIGIRPEVSQRNYVYCSEIDKNSCVDTGVVRSTGWHRFALEVTDRGTFGRVDGKTLPFVDASTNSINRNFINTNLTKVGYINLGVYGSVGNGDVYFDDVLVELLPNIVVIMTDDQDDTGSMSFMKHTKELISDRGVTFKNSFVDFSLCCPDRVSFLTGQAAHNHQILDIDLPDGGYQKFEPSEGNSLPVWLQNVGYHTSLIGKYPNKYGQSSTGPTHVPPGWSTWMGLPDSNGTYRYYNYDINVNGKLEHYGTSPEDYKTDVLARKAVEVINGQAGSSTPIFMWLTPLAPHQVVPLRNFPEVIPAPRHKGLLANVPLPKSPNFNEEDFSDKPSFMRTLSLFDTATVSAVTNLYHQRMESLLAVDEMVKNVVEALQSTGRLDNTIIVFTSDNGFFTGQHRRTDGKQLVYEESIRVPLAIRGPGIPEGQVRTQMVNVLDLVATIEALTGVVPGRVPDGRSLFPLFQDPSYPWRTAFLVQGIDRWSGVTSPNFGTFMAIRTENYKYVEHEYRSGYGGGTEKEFYDLRKDPYELNNGINNPTYTPIVSPLAQTLVTLKNCVGISCWVTSSEPSFPGDLNGDGRINLFDYNFLVANWSHPYTQADYQNVLNNFGK